MSTRPGKRFDPSTGTFRRTLLTAVLLFVASGCVRQEPASGPFPAFADFQGNEVDAVSFTGEIVVPRDSLKAVVRTRPSRCRFLFLPICIGSFGRDEYRLDLSELALDIARLQIYHRDHGYYSTEVEPIVEPAGQGEVTVEFAITPGRRVFLRDLSISGLDTIVDETELLRSLPLQVDEPFGRTDFFASADSIREQLLQRGHAYAQVLRNYGIDTIAGIAEAQYVAIPGPQVVIDSVLIVGNERLSERTIRRHLTFSEGEILVDRELSRTQRSLYNLGMVNFAVVEIAPDTLQVDEDLERATVLVQIVEAAQFAVDAAAGFGSVECIRSDARWINRNFFGGARRLELFGSVSRIGVGSPADFGFGGNLCATLSEEAFLGIGGEEVRDRIDYTLGADFQQPSIFGTQNRLALNAHAERVTEPSAFIRESVGGSLATVREFGFGSTVLTTRARVELGTTIASPAILCLGFDTCTQDDLDLLSQNRWSNALAVNVIRDRSRTDGVTTSGYIGRAAVDWAPGFASDDDYLRVVAEASRYWRVRPGWVLAANLRGGRFFRGLVGSSGYVPPEQRFYAGGPSSVRGYGRNELGPRAYVVPTTEINDTIGSATGGTQMATGSLELRLPSPVLSDVARLAIFVDGGHVSNPGSDLPSSTGVRFTPGIGLRFLTPVGPFRVDVAYNPYDTEVGPLYVLDPLAGLLLIDPRYSQTRRGFLRHLRVQFALGQAF